jgi:hypothetical protein
MRRLDTADDKGDRLLLFYGIRYVGARKIEGRKVAS